MKAASLSIFRHLFSSIAEEMGISLGRTAYSPNIKERLDFSCAVFLGDGRLLAQAAHIPVHLGAMPASVRAAIEQCSPIERGDIILVNDPYQGGTHLPDLTMISPAFCQTGRLVPDFFVASRAHHADIGGMSPGSMPLSTEIFQEGLIIPPVKIFRSGHRDEDLWRLILQNVRTPLEREGDLAAQLAANATGLRRLNQLIAQYTFAECLNQAHNLLDYASRMTRSAIAQIPDGQYSYCDYLDDDGQSSTLIPINVTITVGDGEVIFDFAGTAEAVQGNLNAVPAIVESAVVYCLRCIALRLLGIDLPMNQGVTEPLTIKTERGSLLDPSLPHAVSAGNVETSQRIVDVVFGALSLALPNIIPAASQGTMNNVTFGSSVQLGSASSESDRSSRQLNIRSGEPFAYYETIGGGIGAGPDGSGGSGMHAHMSNTRNTPVEALEYDYPIHVLEYRIRDGSGGMGQHTGGDGLVRTLEFLVPVSVTLVSERRRRPPYGLQGGQPGKIGRNSLIRDKHMEILPGKMMNDLDAGDCLRIETPGGGGWGIANHGNDIQSDEDT